MNKITRFFWFCSGADQSLLEKCKTETSKYVGIGATIFFTGLFAALAGGYALYTVFDSVWASLLFGLIWGLMIFNLDRYIVSSMKKEGKTGKELLMASPRLILAILISIVIAKPLELKIFDKEIQPELIVMEQQAYAGQEKEVRARFSPVADSLKAQVTLLKQEIQAKTAQRDALRKTAQEEADGTGGSRKKNLGPIYKVKKADADKADEELSQLTTRNEARLRYLEAALNENDSIMQASIFALQRTKLNGPAARLEALDRLTAKSNAIAIANIFILLLFIALETAPVFVKLISTKGPYDNLLHSEEHLFVCGEIEAVATANAETKQRTSVLPQHEREFASAKLDALLKRYP
jgi:hypothetical protein